MAAAAKMDLALRSFLWVCFEIEILVLVLVVFSVYMLKLLRYNK